MQAWSKFANFLTKFSFRKQSGGTNLNAEGQFVMFSRSGQWHFNKLSRTFEKVCFAKSPHTTQLLTFVYLRQVTLSQKALRHALLCPFYSTLAIKTLHVHGC